MSKLWSAEMVAAATARPLWAKAEEPGAFTAWGFDRAQVEQELAEIAPHMGLAPAPEPVDMAAVEEAAFAAGREAGLQEAADVLMHERAAMQAIVAAAEVLRPEPTGALAALLAETVERLVRQIVGSVEIERETLLARVEAAAHLIGEETAPAVLRLHPHDLERLDGAALPVPARADPSLDPGTLRLETARGWIEDGPAVRLERLRAALGQMGALR